MEQNKKIVRELLDAIGNGDVDVADRLLLPDVTWEIATAAPGGGPFGGVTGKAAFLDNLRGLGAVFTDGFRYEISHVTAEEDRVAVEAEGIGRAHGLDFRNRYHFLFQLRDGGVAAAREYMDYGHALAFHTQLAEHLQGTNES